MRVREEHARTGSRVFAFRTMREYPLVRYGDMVMPLSQRFLLNKFTDGLLWRLRDHGQAAGLGGRVPTWLGQLFEHYVYNEFEAAHAVRAGFQARVHRAVRYKWHKNPCESADVSIGSGDRLILVEVALRQMRLEETQIRAGRREFAGDVQEIIVHNAAQLDRNIRAFRNGAYIIPDVDPRHVRRIYPVIVTLGHMPDGDLVWAEYERALRQATLLHPAAIGMDVARLQLLTVEEIEVLRDLIQEGMSLADLLERKDTEPYRNMGFKNFLFDIVRDRLRVRGATRQQAVDRMKQRVLRLLAGTPPDATT